MAGLFLTFVLYMLHSQVTGQSLNGRRLEITTIPSPPLVIVNTNLSASQYGDKYEGIFIDILKKLSYQANFTYNIHIVKDSRYGSESTPGVWDGMVGELQNNEADVAVAPLTIASKRASVITYTQPIMDSGLRILYRKPAAASSKTISLMVLLAPFTTGTWFLIVASFVAASMAFFATGKLSPFEEIQSNPQIGDNMSITATLINAFVYSTSSFFHQERASVPRSASGRTLSVFWWIFATLVLTTFAANFTAFLLTRPPDIRTRPFMTFDELSKQTDVKYGVVKGGYTINYFKNSKQPLQQKMWKAMSANPKAHSNSIRAGAARVRSENYAFIIEGPGAEYISGQYPCDTMVVGGPLDDRAYGFACGQNSDICSLLNPFIIRLKDNNFLADTKNKWMRSSQCSNVNQGRVKIRGSPVVDVFKKAGIKLETQLSFSRFSAALFILLTGIIISMLVLGGEIFYAYKTGVPQK